MPTPCLGLCKTALKTSHMKTSRSSKTCEASIYFRIFYTTLVFFVFVCSHFPPSFPPSCYAFPAFESSSDSTYLFSCNASHGTQSLPSMVPLQSAASASTSIPSHALRIENECNCKKATLHMFKSFEHSWP